MNNLFIYINRPKVFSMYSIKRRYFYYFIVKDHEILEYEVFQTHNFDRKVKSILLSFVRVKNRDRQQMK